MSIKTIARGATARMGKQVLAVKTHSPTILVGAGVVSILGSVVLACRSTLKLSDILSEGENKISEIDGKIERDGGENKVLEKSKFNVQLQTAIEVVKLYAPSALLLTAGIAAVAGSHVILRKRNAGLAAAYTVVDQMHKDYRKRVVADQGEEKDREYAEGVEEREVVTETKDGPVVETVKGVDQEAMLAEDPEKVYRRVFNSKNKHWSDIPNQNQFTLQMYQSEANDLLRLQGYLFLNQVYDMLGFEPTVAGQIVGWRKNPKPGEGDGFVSFGVWNDGVYEGTKWLNGDKEAIKLDFNVDGPILDSFQKV